MTDPASAARRLRHYLNALPDTSNLGAQIVYGPEFTHANGRPNGAYALDRADLATVLDQLDQHAAELAENEGVIRARRRQRDQTEAERDKAVRAVQGWMALDLHMALGKPVDHSATHQGYGSWADWWADLCAEVRGRQGH